jgi:ketosteroid isomerase-like protein
MRISPVALCALSLVLPVGRAAGAEQASVIVEQEMAFAVSVRSLGVRDGFLDWLSSTGIVFRPGPVIGRNVYEKQPLGWNGLLAWNAVHAALSADGKMGWSTGPWTWRSDSTAPVAQGHGEYLSVWKRAADGRWKVALDCGIGHPAPATTETTVTYSAPVPGQRLGSQPLAARKSLYDADASFARLSGSESVPAALGKFATDDVIVLREGEQRLTGRGRAQGALEGRESKAKLVSTAQYIAESGDLGYTYGTFVTGGTSAPDSAWYVHVWHRGPSASWRLACQMVMPLPAKQVQAKPD